MVFWKRIGIITLPECAEYIKKTAVERGLPTRMFLSQIFAAQIRKKNYPEFNDVGEVNMRLKYGWVQYSGETTAGIKKVVGDLPYPDSHVYTYWLLVEMGKIGKERKG